ncbi:MULTISPECIES: 23S rRNA (uridine(2552)-2'-O)-methyltransferase RlmE [Marichromatium]|uniref:Ribosomal RNA large subunit methyltransferase E n=1 Tax=Marichromatium gracile TaxID=1048 RepID=A0A4R4A9A5_MARGR|nr:MULTISPECIES: 23S rRNA (uridine(2552)-2'-O)-methyltransferase RlmE [Marichromatium]MBO8085472.1 23S rRNA (uridine(2552)-2'-O)-methyltransferase RlmE [Marichromatium sp.]KXX65321.1 23S rRNA methyltransferase [Marichromatium gracile]MBK1708816.1 23S rRNA (uridine(2552)-2'-O)-methyltransferase RlmE [Marichromatium gracile]RNE88969.1 23S rRNA (uridine(2552)-2'-O)-methyltransferase RlmE [Marichromatium sp. AB31]RNE93042.1 23S rRNA (uridine(2552)-2'-O)-methyltransferase RlmE [Marichromatium sp. A
MARSKSSRRWLDRHVGDPFVKQAQQDGYRSRAAYKLLELQERDRLLAPGMRVVDLGAAPGSWSQVAARLVGKQGRVVALDLLPIDPLPGVEILQGDFREQAVLEQLEAALEAAPLDVVLSDMAPNITGTAVVDQARVMYLVELALELARARLKPGGALAVKVFQGSGFDDYLRTLRQSFSRVVTRKPKSSRSASREVYLVAKGFNP